MQTQMHKKQRTGGSETAKKKGTGKAVYTKMILNEESDAQECMGSNVKQKRVP
jgi:hypothetical protein